MIIAWVRPALSLLRVRFGLGSAVQRLHALGTDLGLRRWLRELYPNSREVQGDAAIPPGWLAAYVAIGVLWHAVHTALNLAFLPLTLLKRIV